MQPKFIASISTDATELEGAARDLAVGIVAAVAVDDDGIVLVGPLSPIIEQDQILALHLMIARPAGALVAMHIVPTYALDIATARVREQFRDAILQALARHCRVQAYTSVGELIAAARAPHNERPKLLH